jgi:hypothetical protein
VLQTDVFILIESDNVSTQTLPLNEQIRTHKQTNSHKQTNKQTNKQNISTRRNAGWHHFSDLDTDTVLGRWDAAVGPQYQNVGLPFPTDYYPFLTLGNDAVGLAGGVPVDGPVFVSRTECVAPPPFGNSDATVNIALCCSHISQFCAVVTLFFSLST